MHLPDTDADSVADGRWPRARAAEWHARQPWLCGFNYLPGTAVNFIDMWQAGSFDPDTMVRELGWAAEIGFNTLRTNLPYLVWREDRDGLIARIDTFLGIAGGLGLSAVLCLMDDCGFSGEAGRTGPQPRPVPGVHNSRAVASPGREIVIDRTAWPDIARYVGELVSVFRRDRRILAWDIYNEPGNHMLTRADGAAVDAALLEPASHDLLIESFSWARAAGPEQPLTAGAWHMPMPWEPPGGGIYEHPIDRAAIALSDVISFHAYSPIATMREAIGKLAAHGRPLLCTEWMARSAGSRISEQLPLFRQQKIGAWQWGLVNGKTQTHLPWPQIAAVQPESGEWFHDLLHADGTPYDPAETALITRLTGVDRR